MAVHGVGDEENAIRSTDYHEALSVSPSKARVDAAGREAKKREGVFFCPYRLYTRTSLCPAQNVVLGERKFGDTTFLFWQMNGNLSCMPWGYIIL